MTRDLAEDPAVRYLLKLLAEGKVDDHIDQKLEAARLLLSFYKCTPISGRGETASPQSRS